MEALREEATQNFVEMGELTMEKLVTATRPLIAKV